MINLIILTSLFIYGWHYSTSYSPIGSTMDNPYGTDATDKQIFWFFRFSIGNFIYKKYPKFKWILKPLFGCLYCMSSIYGSLIFFGYKFYNGINPIDFIIWPLFCFCVCGFIRIIEMIRP